MPPTIIAPIATILMSASQNSISPNTLTLHRFSAQISMTMPSTQIHCGTSGNQKPM